ncbi:hypothetical protein C0J52_00515 [Blattella germanica]|nr:hypothetical protein C0J52_00515 [Blattella germanica]
MFRGCNWIGRYLNCCEHLSIQRSEAGFCYSFNSLSGESTKNCTQDLPEEFLFEIGPIQKNSTCNLRRNIAAGLSTGLEIFLGKLPEEDSLGKDQMYPNGFQVMINHPLVPPESSKSIYVEEMPGHFFTIKISYSITKAAQELRGMSVTSRNCLFPDERKSKYFGFYTFETCLMECRIRHIIDRCKCYPHFFDIHEATMRAFNPPGKHDWLETRQDLFLNCSCLPTCHEASFQINYDQFPDTNPYSSEGSGHLDVFYKELGAIKYRRQLAFNFMNLLGNILLILLYSF